MCFKMISKNKTLYHLFKYFVLFFSTGFYGSILISDYFGLKKGSGTYGTLLALVLYSIFYFPLHGWNGFLFLIVFTCISIFFCSFRFDVFTQDDNRIIIDEVCGYFWAIGFIPPDVMQKHTVMILCLAFVLFRFFDITKFPFKKIESIKSGFGIVLDDVVAGIISNVILHLFLYCFIL